MKFEIYKYQGCGNDFVLIDNRSEEFPVDSDIVKWLCDRRFGVGADGLMLLENDAEYDFKMRYFNCDGGEASMCGNGGRCIVLFAHHLGIGSEHKLFMGIDGLHQAQILEYDNSRAVVKLEMIDVDSVQSMGDDLFLDTGSPHYVHFCENPDNEDVVAYGRSVRYGEYFLQRGGTNVNMVQILSENELFVRTYERGVEDETLACGTGVTASAIAATVKTASKENHWHVKTRGGLLTVDFERDSNGRFGNIRLTGSAVRVFATEIDLNNYEHYKLN
jgi:diaminopimelate epimerase